MGIAVDFVAVEFPQANRPTPHVLAAVTERERGSRLREDQSGAGGSQGETPEAGKPWEPHG